MDKKILIEKIRKFSETSTKQVVLSASGAILSIVVFVILLFPLLCGYNVEFLWQMAAGAALLGIAFEIYFGNLSIKKRRRIIKAVSSSKKSEQLLWLLEHITEPNLTPKYKKSFVYIDIKDIFIKALFEWVKSHNYDELYDEVLENKLTTKEITKKQYLLITIFRCLSYKKGDANDTIIIKGLEDLLSKFKDVIDCENNHGIDYIEKCKSICEKYIKEYTDENAVDQYYVGQIETIEEDLGKSFYKFVKDDKAIKRAKKLILAVAIVFFGLQFTHWCDEVVSVVFNGISIILLIIEVLHSSEE